MTGMQIGKMKKVARPKTPRREQARRSSSHIFQRPSDIKSISKASEMSQVPVGLRRGTLEGFGGETRKNDDSKKLRPISEVNEDLAALMNDGKFASFVPGYVKLPIKSIKSMKEENGKTLYEVEYHMPDCRGQRWLTANDIALFDGAKMLDAFLREKNLLPILDAQQGGLEAGKLENMKAIVEELLAFLSPKKGMKEAVAKLAQLKLHLASIPTSIDEFMGCTKRVRKGPGQTEYNRKKKAAQASLKEVQEKSLAGVDEACREIRVAVACADEDGAVRNELVSIAQAKGGEIKESGPPVCNNIAPVTVPLQVTKAQPPIHFAPKFPIEMPNESSTTPQQMTKTLPSISFAPKISSVSTIRSEDKEESVDIGEMVNTMAGKLDLDELDRTL